MDMDTDMDMDMDMDTRILGRSPIFKIVDCDPVNLPISPPHKAKSTPYPSKYLTSNSNQKPGVGPFDAPRRVALGSGWVKNKNYYFLNYGR